MRSMCLILPWLCVLPVAAQNAADPQPLATTTAPAVDGSESLQARAIEVIGDVQAAPLGTDGWQPVQTGALVSHGTKILTGTRSSAKFQIGDEEPYTVLVIESNALTVIGEAYKTAQRKRTRIGVGRGRVRAGVAEGGLQSDFVVDTPVATLSKRGTWNFGAYYEQGTNRFEFFLLDRGLADVMHEITQEQRALEPGQLVDQAMRRWFEQAKLVRNVPMPDPAGQPNEELAFDDTRTEGFGVTNPGGGRSAVTPFANSRTRIGAPLFGRLNPGRGLALPQPGGGPPTGRPEGNFGTGRGDSLLGGPAPSSSIRRLNRGH